jgi:hypothetical protein
MPFGSTPKKLAKHTDFNFETAAKSIIEVDTKFLLWSI